MAQSGAAGLPGLLVIAVLGLLAVSASSYAYVAMIVVLLIASAPVYTAFALQKYSTGSAPVFEAVKALLVASGYRIGAGCRPVKLPWIV